MSQYSSNNTHFYKYKNIIGFDNEWQFPAITEKYAFDQLKKYIIEKEFFIYFAFPWATLIDLLIQNKKNSEALLNTLYSIIKLIPKDKKIITVCQHIHLLKFQYLFKEAGISAIFWSHCTINSSFLPNYPEILLKPFPLYPVNYQFSKINSLKKKYFVSYLGAQSSSFYLSQIRNELPEILKKFKNTYCELNEKWHYNTTVYDNQIFKKNIKNPINFDKTKKFNYLLKNSRFILCPSGSGPNSIRLWECIESEVIPIVMSETYKFPGNFKIWQDAIIICNENTNDLTQLLIKLEKFQYEKNFFEKKILHLKYIKFLYGKNFFIHDINKYILQNN